MNLLGGRSKNLRGRVLLVCTIAAVLLFSLHPELRLLIPLVDALGVDLLAMLLGAQLWGYARPILLAAYRFAAPPLMRRSYSIATFLFGYGGPYIHAKLAIRFPHLGLAP
jgi:hypothetical protein